MKNIFLISVLIGSVVSFNQSDYSMSFERVELVQYNTDVIRDAKLVTYKYNRTQPAVNFSLTVVINVGNDIQGTIQAYTFLSNEYRTFPLRYSFDMCDAIDKDEYGLKDIFRYGNFTGCPVKKGTYFIYNWKPNSSRFPPHIPNGQYMAELQLSHSSTELGLIKVYGTISRPLGRRH